MTILKFLLKNLSIVKIWCVLLLGGLKKAGLYAGQGISSDPKCIPLT